ncbi:MAG: slipin family protein [Candidatus Diapherotrites archaeon]|nr:slipin family protein [Candidatus Diapherotrites archaeon]
MINLLYPALFLEGLFFPLMVILGLFVVSGIKIVNEYERGVKFRLGKYQGILEPGLRIVVPFLETWNRVDMRVKVIDVPDQDAMTKDNISLNVNAVLYFRVIDSAAAIIKVEHFAYAVSQLAQTTMRDVVGEVEMDELLTKRDAISRKIKEIVDKATDPWGIKVESVEMKHIELPTEMKRVMAKQAEAEREKRSTIIKAEGELIASTNLADAAKKLSSSTGALHLRTLQTINDISSDQSNTIIFLTPVEVLEAFKNFGNTKKKNE